MTVQVREMITYDRNLSFTWSLCLKLRFKFKENEVIIPQISLIMFDGIIGSDTDVNNKKRVASTIAQRVESIK